MVTQNTREAHVSCSVLTLCNPTDFRPARLLYPWHSLGKNTGVGSYSLFQGIFPTQGSNPGLLHFRQIFFFFFFLFLPSEPAGKPWGPDRVIKSAPCKHHTLFGMQNLKWLRTEVCSSVDISTLCHRIRVWALPPEAWVLTGSSHFPDIVGIIYCSNLGCVKVKGGHFYAWQWDSRHQPNGT